MWLLEQYNKGKFTKEIVLKRRVETFRSYRRNLLKAFDIWERAVLRGREEDSEEVMNWYNEMLDFPTKIKYNSLVKDYPKRPKELDRYIE